MLLSGHASVHDRRLPSRRPRPLYRCLDGAGGDGSHPGEITLHGTDLSGWTADVPARDDDPSLRDSFIVRDGLLVSLGPRRGIWSQTRAIATTGSRSNTASPANRQLRRLDPCVDAAALYDMFPKSIEVQMMSGDAGDFWCIQEDIRVENMKQRRPRKEGQEWGGAEGRLQTYSQSHRRLGEATRRVEHHGGRSSCQNDHRVGQR